MSRNENQELPRQPVEVEDLPFEESVQNEVQGGKRGRVPTGSVTFIDNHPVTII